MKNQEEEGKIERENLKRRIEKLEIKKKGGKEEEREIEVKKLAKKVEEMKRRWRDREKNRERGGGNG